MLRALKILDDQALDEVPPDELRAAYRELRRRVDCIVLALEDLRSRGLFTGGLPPYGFEVDRGCDAQGAALREAAREQQTLVRARELRARGMTLRGIAHQLEEEGRLSRNGARFAPTQINRMIRPRKTRGARAEPGPQDPLGPDNQTPASETLP